MTNFRGKALNENKKVLVFSEDFFFSFLFFFARFG